MAVKSTALILGTVHAFYCGNPLCSKIVEQTRSWQKCRSATCHQQYLFIHRVRCLLKRLSDERWLKIKAGYYLHVALTLSLRRREWRSEVRAEVVGSRLQALDTH
jgi:hypothetical protein